jgi:hypothetical protein
MELGRSVETNLRKCGGTMIVESLTIRGETRGCPQIAPIFADGSLFNLRKSA